MNTTKPLNRVLVLLVFFSFVIPAVSSIVDIDPKEDCASSLSNKCTVIDGDVKLGKICQHSDFQSRLEKNLEYVSNSSVDCSELERAEVENALEPPLSEQIRNSAPALLVLTAVIGVLVSPFIASMILSVYYGEDKTEKLYLIGYGTFIPVLSFFTFLIYILTIRVLYDALAYLSISYSPIFFIFFYGVPAVLAIILYAYILIKATRKVMAKTGIQSRRLMGLIFSLGFLSGLILILSLVLIFFSQGTLGTL